MDNVMNRYEYFRLGKQFEGKCVIRRENGHCCMKVNKVVIYYNKNDMLSSFIELHGYGYEVRNKNGFKSNVISDDCCVCLLNHSHLKNLEIISEEKFAGLMKDVFNEIMGNSVGSSDVSWKDSDIVIDNRKVL